MPLVKIDLKKGKNKEFLCLFMDLTHEALVQALKIPFDDNNMRLTQFEEEFFRSKPPYEFFIEIILFSGRSAKIKAKLFKSIVDKLKDNLNVDPKTVFIVINEQPLENWGIRGGIQASDVPFDFNIKI